MSAPQSVDDGLLRYENVPAYGVLRHAAEVCPDRDAIHYGDLQWTYEQLNYDSVRCAAMLQRLGVRSGDRVGVLLPNLPEYLIAVNGIWRAGGVVVALSPLMVAEEVSTLLRQTDCKIVICLDLLAQMLGEEETPLEKKLFVSIRDRLPSIQQLGYLWMRHSRTGRWLLPTSDRSTWFWAEMEASRREWKPVEIDTVNDPAYILPTGGTTGSPKAVALSHQNIVANAWQQFEWTGRKFGSETMMGVLPFFHSYGMSTTVLGGPMMAATMVLSHRFSTQHVVRLIERERPTVFHAVPAILIAMVGRLKTHKADLSSLRWVISGGAPLEESLANDFSQFCDALVVEGYGLSEASPVTHVGDLSRAGKFGGLPIPETQCRIVDSRDGKLDVPDGDVGELIIAGPQIMLGYWRDDAATRQTIRDGWLFTGDLAVVDGDGYYRIVGRKKDLIITSGYNVYPAEVEAALLRAPGVKDVAVIGVPDERKGEVVMAFIAIEPGTQWDESALREHCSVALSKHKQPRIYERCIDDLPRNFLGKVIRRELRVPSAVATEHVDTKRNER